MRALPNRAGYFGEFGGKYVPETLMAALDEFEGAYRKLRRDRSFRGILTSLATACTVSFTLVPNSM